MIERLNKENNAHCDNCESDVSSIILLCFVHQCESYSQPIDNLTVVIFVSFHIMLELSPYVTKFF